MDEREHSATTHLLTALTSKIKETDEFEITIFERVNRNAQLTLNTSDDALVATFKTMLTSPIVDDFQRQLCNKNENRMGNCQLQILQIWKHLTNAV